VSPGRSTLSQFAHDAQKSAGRNLVREEEQQEKTKDIDCSQVVHVPILHSGAAPGKSKNCD
jgi:hypothetical protein